MARNRGSLLSDATKMQLARLQGAGDRVAPGDYGNLTSREAGRLVKLAIIAAEQQLAGQPISPSPTQGPTQG